MRIAITRPVSRSFGNCELTFFARAPIDLALARKQHAGYEQVLEALGSGSSGSGPSPAWPIRSL